MTNTILALIRNKGLSDNELVVASAKTTIAWKNKYWQKYGSWEQSGTKEKKAYIDWVGDYETEAFQTSEDLKELEKQFKGKGMAVELHEEEPKEKLTEKTKFVHYGYPVCGLCGKMLFPNEHYRLTNKMSFVCSDCVENNKAEEKISLMLAILGDRKTIKGMI